LLLTDDGARELKIDELEESLRVGRGLDEASFVDGRIGHCAKVRRVVPLGGEERTRPGGYD